MESEAEALLKLLPWPNFAQFSEMILTAPHNLHLIYLLHCILLRNCFPVIAYFNSEFDLKNYHIPDYILVPESKVEAVSYVLECPVIVFINSKSRGSNWQGQSIVIQMCFS